MAQNSTGHQPATITAAPAPRPPSAILQAAGATATITPTGNRTVQQQPQIPISTGAGPPPVIIPTNTTTAINLSSGVTVTPTAARIAAVAAAAAAGGDQQQQHPSVTVSLTAASQQQQKEQSAAVMREVVSQQPLNLKQVSPPSVTVIPSVPTSLRQPLQPQAPVQQQQQQPHGASLPQVPVSVATSVAAPVALSLVMNKSVEIKTVNPALEPQSLAGLDHGPPDAKKPRMAEENGCT